MEIERQDSDGLILRLSENEIVQWSNALNEVCHGFAVENFHAAMGISDEAAKELLTKVGSLRQSQPLYFSLDELLAVRNALTIVLGELHPFEFHSRMGVEVEESREMRNALDRQTGRLQLHKTA